MTFFNSPWNIVYDLIDMLIKHNIKKYIFTSTINASTKHFFEYYLKIKSQLVFLVWNKILTLNFPKLHKLLFKRTLTNKKNNSTDRVFTANTSNIRAKTRFVVRRVIATDWPNVVRAFALKVYVLFLCVVEANFLNNTLEILI